MAQQWHQGMHSMQLPSQSQTLPRIRPGQPVLNPMQPSQPRPMHQQPGQVLQTPAAQPPAMQQMQPSQQRPMHQHPGQPPQKPAAQPPALQQMQPSQPRPMHQRPWQAQQKPEEQPPAMQQMQPSQPCPIHQPPRQPPLQPNKPCSTPPMHPVHPSHDQPALSSSHAQYQRQQQPAETSYTAPVPPPVQPTVPAAQKPNHAPQHTVQQRLAPGGSAGAASITHAVHATTARSLPRSFSQTALVQSTLSFSQGQKARASAGAGVSGEPAACPRPESRQVSAPVRIESEPRVDLATASNCNAPAFNPSGFLSGNEAVPLAGVEELGHWAYPTNREVREYQVEMVKAGLFDNTLVALPTGLGKTLIAAVIMFNFIRCGSLAGGGCMNSTHCVYLLFVQCVFSP